MGLPLPTTASPASGTPASGDQANAVVSGAFNGAGQVSAPFCIYGAFNVVMYPALTKTVIVKGDGTATVNIGPTGGGLAVGESISSTVLPPGTTIASLTSATVNLVGFTTFQIGGLTTAQVAGLTTTQTDTAAVITGTTVVGAGVSATVNLERSFDGGSTWITCGVGGGGSPASYPFGSAGLTDSVSFVVAEPERGVAYRLHCIAYSSGTISYRISTTGLAAMAWGIPIG